MKRFTETEKWHDPWFRSLPAPAKLVFIYLTDRCNNAGFLELDKELLIIMTKLRTDHLDGEKGAFKALERGIKEADGWVWVRRFLHHQKNAELNPANPAHKQIIVMLKEQVARFGKCDEFISFISPYLEVLGLTSPNDGASKPHRYSTGKGKGKEEEGSREKKPAFLKPTIEAVIEYGKEIGLEKTQCESWYDHFEANGWRVGGKTKMVKWHASLRNAKRNPISNNGATPKLQQEFKTV